ncbi:ABC transporter permease [Leucobacter sp. 1207-22]|uniref:ABC transporter permease n=1 Tax=Leucobacter sp. 1207-22 TaxID=2604456 RepID=UPI00406471EE
MALLEVDPAAQQQLHGNASREAVAPEARPYRAPRWPRVVAAAALIAMAAFIAIPMLAGLWFSFWIPSEGLTLTALTDAISSPAVMGSLGLSLGLSLVSVALLLVILVPTVVLLHVSAQRYRPLVEAICMVPLVVPAIALVAGVLAVLRAGVNAGEVGRAVSQFLQDPSFPLVLLGCYVIVLLPFTFRIIDNALAAIPVAQLLDSARGLGAPFPVAVFRVIAPNIGAALWYCAFFGLSAGLAEYTFSISLGFHTLSVELMTLSGSNFRTSIAVSLLVTLLSWMLMILVLQAPRRVARRKVRS